MRRNSLGFPRSYDQVRSLSTFASFAYFRPRTVIASKISAEAADARAISKFDNTTITSNEQGFFVIEGATPGTNKVLKYNKTNYMPGTTTVDVVAGQETFTNLSLKQVGKIQQVIGSVINTVADVRSDGRNGSITIPANKVVNAAGLPVSSYNVEITTLLPSDPNFTSLFPGKFLGGSTPGSTANPQPLISYGMVNVDLKDAQGNKLFLANGATATLNFPIDNNPVHDPGTASVPIWYLDESSGIWIQEGVATRSGSFYTAQVSHLTPWNIDTKNINNGSYKTVKVVGLDGTPVQNALVTVEGTGYRQVLYTGPDGTAQAMSR